MTKKRNAIIYDSIKMQHKDGYYYVWFNALKKKENCLVFDIRFDDLRNLKDIKKIYFTHSFVNWITKILFEIRKLNFSNITFKDLKKLIILFLISRKTKNVLISKNDYEGFLTKIISCYFLNCSNLVTHSKFAKKIFKKYFKNVVWAPYSCDKKRFLVKNDISINRNKKVGFIGRCNSKELKDDSRYRLLKLARNYWKGDADIRLIDVEKINPLEGDEYAKWLKSCKAIINFESMHNHVNARMWEIFAAERIPLSLEGTYEGILYPFINYIPIEKVSLKELKKADNFLLDEDLCERIVKNNLNLLEHFSVANCIEKFI